MTLPYSSASSGKNALDDMIAAMNAKDALIRELVGAVTHEREMVCQDIGMQLAAGEAVDAALAKAKEAGYD